MLSTRRLLKLALAFCFDGSPGFSQRTAGAGQLRCGIGKLQLQLR